MNAKKKRRGADAGFTLLEIIVVMVILSTVLAMAGPSLRGFFASRKANDTAAQILALTQYSRSQAISEGITYRLTFDIEERTYWLTAWQSGAFQKLKTEFGQIFTLPKDMEVELEDLEEDDEDADTEIFLKFTPQGTVTAGAVRLIDRSGRILEVRCPTVTESFAIVEGQESNGEYTSKKIVR